MLFVFCFWVLGFFETEICSAARLACAGQAQVRVSGFRESGNHDDQAPCRRSDFWPQVILLLIIGHFCCVVPIKRKRVAVTQKNVGSQHQLDEYSNYSRRYPAKSSYPTCSAADGAPISEPAFSANDTKQQCTLHV